VGLPLRRGWRTTPRTHEVKDHSLAAFRQQRDESLALLGGHLAVYHVHSATLDTGVLDDRRCTRARRAARHGCRGRHLDVGTEQAARSGGRSRSRSGGRRCSRRSSRRGTSSRPRWRRPSPRRAGGGHRARQGARRERAPRPGTQDRSPGARRVVELAAGLGTGEDALALAAALAQPWDDARAVRRGDARAGAQQRLRGRLRLPPDVLDELAALAESRGSTGRRARGGVELSDLRTGS
jgi:hypothetical protein